MNEKVQNKQNKLKIKKKKQFEVTSNMIYVLKTDNPKESAGKDKTTFSLRKKALKKTSPGQNWPSRH